MAAAQLIPNQFLFRFAFPCRYRAKLPLAGPHVADLPDSHRLAFLGAMDGLRAFADVRIGWNEHGLALVWQTRLKTAPIYGEPGKPKACDGLSLWLDTRDTRTIHRASRFCHRFVFAVHNGEEAGVPEAFQFKIHRALADAPHGELAQVRLARFAIDEDSSAAESADSAKIVNYRMEVFLPAAILHGFDPDVNRRLGIFYRLRDHEQGDQLLGPAPELPYWEDPSLWHTFELIR